jgi:hypothetical protein
MDMKAEYFCGCFCGENILQRFLPFLVLLFTLTDCYQRIILLI